MKIKIIKHKTLAAILKAYFQGDKPDERGIWTWYGSDGKRQQMSMPHFRKVVSKRGVWAFVLGKKELHIWIGARCLFHDLLADLGHELGHFERPWTKPGGRFEEIKASKYERVVSTAYDMANDLWEGDPIHD
jgi:hypothetical protein